MSHRGNDTLKGGGGADTLTGGGGDDIFQYNSAVELFASGTAIDSIVGGAGTLDQLSLNTNTGDIVISATDNFGRIATVERIHVVGASNRANLTLGASAQTAGITHVSLSTHTNASARHTVDASAYLAASGITLFGSQSADSLVGGAGVDGLEGGAGADTLTGGGGNDSFIYRALADFFTGGALVDSITGGAGTSDSISLDTTASNITISATDAFTGMSGVEQLRATGSTNSANITLGASAQTVGIAQVSLASHTNASANHVVNAGVYTSQITLLGGSGGDRLTGGSANDSLSGGAGSDTLTGGGGADILVGGDGNDSFVYRSAAELFSSNMLIDSITGGAGTDSLTLDTIAGNITIANTVNFSRASGVEQIIASGTANTASITLGTTAQAAGIRRVDLSGLNSPGVANTTTFTAGVMLIGGVAADTLTGGTGADTLEGGRGADLMFGGAGDDLFQYRTTGDLIANGAALDSINAQGGTDSLHLFTDTADFVLRASDSFLNFQDFERIAAAGSANSAQLTLGSNAQTLGITTIDLSGHTNTSATHVVNTSAYTTPVTITGSVGTDSVTGGASGDTINLRGGEATTQSRDYVTLAQSGGSIDTLQGFRVGSAATSDVIRLDISVFGRVVNGGATVIMDSDTANLQTVAIAAGTMAVTLAAATNILVLRDKAYANSTAVLNELSGSGFSFSSAAAAGDDLFVIWRNGTDAHLGVANIATLSGNTISSAGVTEIATLSGVDLSSGNPFNAVNFDFV
ncbi:MAG: hypothetical protein AAF352_02150 [Pseudomonadota bacterium]